MSGGNLSFSQLANIADGIDDILQNPSEEIPEEVRLKMVKTKEELMDMWHKVRAIDYFIGGDFGLDTFLDSCDSISYLTKSIL
jgi:GTP cyclohydrolase III